MENKRYHYLYKTTNLINGDYYYGMHSTYNLNDGYIGSGKRLKYSINKYGKENHKIEILEFFNSREELVEREKEIINLNEIAKIECMNLTVGGGGGFTQEQQRINNKKSLEKQKILRETDIEWVKKKSKKLTYMLKKAYKEGRREKKIFCDWTNRKHKKESKLKISKSMKGKGVGKENSQYGTCWIMKDEINKKIKKDDLNDYIKTGWKLGRKLKKTK